MAFEFSSYAGFRGLCQWWVRRRCAKANCYIRVHLGCARWLYAVVCWEDGVEQYSKSDSMVSGVAIILYA